MPRGPREQALFGEPGMPPPRMALAALAGGGAVRRRSRRPRGRRGVLLAQDCATADAAHRGVARGARPGLGAPDAVAVRAGGHHRSFLDRAELARACPPAATRVIRLDPGLAFGTGTHPTTRMCLRWIADHAAALAPSWRRVLDYGCGSGILAIAAALHGARDIDAVDIDPARGGSHTRQRHRQRRRRCAARPARSRTGRLRRWCWPTSWPRRCKLLAPLLCAHVAPAGAPGAGRHPGSARPTS